MDLVKIGKFISECRKNKKLTQEQLAEKIGISDRAISKWERGLGLPDASIMIPLCEILGINVNELLSGEMLDKNNYGKEAEKKLVEMVKREENKNKQLMIAELVIIGLCVAGILAISLLVEYFVKDSVIANSVMIGTVLVVLIVFFFAMKLEVAIGYYECKYCKHRYERDFWQAFWAWHMGFTKYMKCPKCGKKSWQKKVMTK